MRYYPVNLKIAGRPCLVIGGGRVAERKVKGLLACGARVTVVSPELTPRLAALHRENRIAWHDRSYRPGDLAGAFLAIAATDDEPTQEAVQQEAEQDNILLNIADVPHRCNFILPSILSRGDLTIAVSTGGKSPALAKQIREQLEEQFGPEYALYLDLLGKLRAIILEQEWPTTANKPLFESLLHPDMPLWLRTGEWLKIEAHLQAVLPEAIGRTCLNRLKLQFQSAGSA
ncbi:MAG: bifunctional precorrin-2 dehydrogenase/sirohydrochlorin ferrochelatase [Desulfobacteraceae bacterium]|nr:bifunctional precorrin-2 dehydrogenase/sirohydrochlorin ferrochelatase [Desulfobacteraceae bacterium]